MVKAVIFDFYNTLAETTNYGPSWEELLDELGYTLPPDIRDRWWNDGIDGTEHDEHSQSRDHYVAWQQSRVRLMLAECGVPEAAHDDLIVRVREIGAHNRIDAYDEVDDVIRSLRAQGRGARDLFELGLGPPRGGRVGRAHRRVRRRRLLGLGRCSQGPPAHLHAHAGAARCRPRGRALRRRHLDLRRRRPARGGHAGDLPPPNTPRHRPHRPRAARSARPTCTTPTTCARSRRCRCASRAQA